MADASRTWIRTQERTYRDDFRGCTDRNPDSCACADDFGAASCSRCGEALEDGDRVIDTTRWTLYDGDPEWRGLSDNETRHVTCPEAPRG